MLVSNLARKADLKAPILEELLEQNGVLIHCPKEGFLFKKGESPSLLLIKRGSLLLAGPTVNSLLLLPEGRILGLNECLSNEAWDYAGFAVTDIKALRLLPKELQTLLQKQPDLRMKCLGILLNRGDFE